MILGVLSDTHGDKKAALPHIIRQFKLRNVERIIHCGDIQFEHVNSDIFGGLPVYCALVDNQCDDPRFSKFPENWQFTANGDRIVQIPDHGPVYVGHKRPFDFLTKSEQQITQILDELRKNNDGLRLVFGGHTHFQTYKQGKLISLINPGAVEGSFSGTYEYAVVDTESGQVVFSRILPAPDCRQVFSIGIISDSYDISSVDNTFWGKLAREFSDRGVSHVIHCGNIALSDIGHDALSAFQVHFNLRPDQHLKKISGVPDSWHMIKPDDPTIEINGYRFYVKLDLGMQFQELSESGMDHFSMEILRQYPETKFVLCGFTNDALYVGGVNQVKIINPGDVNCDRNFAVLCLPRNELTFGHVPSDPLPAIS